MNLLFAMEQIEDGRIKSDFISESGRLHYLIRVGRQGTTNAATQSWELER